MNDRKNGTKTDRTGDGKFAKGNSGRPKGSRHRTTLAMQELLDGEGEALTRRAIELAKEGDVTALRLCLERLLPARRDAPVVFSFPSMSSASDATQVVGSVLEAVAKGEVTPEEAKSISTLIETFRRTLETEELERRVAVLEAQK